MIRVVNWDVNLLLWATAQSGQPFLWGITDCGSLARGALDVMYGGSVIDAWPYHTKREALRVHAETGGVEAVLRAHGAYDIGIMFAQQGDFVIEREPDANGLPSCGIVVARMLLCSSPEVGVGFIDLERERPDLIVLRYPRG